MNASTLSKDRLRICVLISGRGSNLAALLAHDEHGDAFQIDHVISDQALAPGLEHARQQAIAATVVERAQFDRRSQFERALLTAIESTQPQLIVLAGFMRILSADFVAALAGRLINIHPSLLPRFPGLNTHQRALEANVKSHGASVHYVTADVDAGPLIGQAELAVAPDDDAQSLAKRVLSLEHRLLPAVVLAIAHGDVVWQDGQTIFVNREQPGPLAIQAQE